ncbi:hypothetical protein DQ04_20991000 [Trypanosoma grayi]|uniref:hypothetical protein n=1 Tax=Trypanosoma grayi TaxID=71804 RepID=UPI0004F45601|nr:hypothetical protein DQ04_20991000 [Trypanosoma grayi]KEG05521.1 hypothetical protein DQ04_20991000 [Trypanosoma grayi]
MLSLCDPAMVEKMLLNPLIRCRKIFQMTVSIVKMLRWIVKVIREKIGVAQNKRFSSAGRTFGLTTEALTGILRARTLQLPRVLVQHLALHRCRKVNVKRSRRVVLKEIALNRAFSVLSRARNIQKALRVALVLLRLLKRNPNRFLESGWRRTCPPQRWKQILACAHPKVTADMESVRKLTISKRTTSPLRPTTAKTQRDVTKTASLCPKLRRHRRMNR